MGEKEVRTKYRPVGILFRCVPTSRGNEVYDPGRSVPGAWTATDTGLRTMMSRCSLGATGRGQTARRRVTPDEQKRIHLVPVLFRAHGRLGRVVRVRMADAAATDGEQAGFFHGSGQ